MKKWIIIIVLVLIGYLVYSYLYQDHRNIKTEQAVFIVSSIEINNEFSKSITQSETKYLNKTIEISGVITEINNIDLTIDSNIFCLLNDTLSKAIKINTKIKIKGRCIGYDNLLEQVKLDQCHIIN